MIHNRVHFIEAAFAAIVLCLIPSGVLNAQVGRYDTSVGKKVDFSYRPMTGGNFVFWGTTIPTLEYSVKSAGPRKDSKRIVLSVTSDTLTHVYTFAQNLTLGPGDSSIVSFSCNLHPGFYKAVLYEENGVKYGSDRVNGSKSDLKMVVPAISFAFEPEKLERRQPSCEKDFDLFWKLAHQDAVLMSGRNKLSKVKNNDGGRRVQLVTINPPYGGEFKAYLFEPRKSGKFPVVISFYDADQVPSPASSQADSSLNRIDIAVSLRGQGLCSSDRSYGIYQAYGIKSRQDYYSKYAYLDGVKALDFAYGLANADRNRIYVEGRGTGAEVALAVAAMDERVAAVAAYAPGMTDFSYMTKWNKDFMEPIYESARNAGISENWMRNTLSYFNIAYFAAKIKCPVLYGVGLQDEKIVPRLSFASYAKIPDATSKEYYVFPDCGHSAPAEWELLKRNFYRKHCR